MRKFMLPCMMTFDLISLVAEARREREGEHDAINHLEEEQ